MSHTRLFFAGLFTIYVVRAIRYEERDLVSAFGERYRRYAEGVPMLVPFIFKKTSPEPAYRALARSKDLNMVEDDYISDT